VGLFYGWWGGIGIFGSYPIRQKNLTMLKQNLKSSLVTDILDRASSEILDKYPDAIIEPPLEFMLYIIILTCIMLEELLS
jgi:hypothetical protein